MFDPTIYENLKVVIEGIVYDLDLQGTILVTGRKDQIDLSSMSRSYAIQFKRKSDSEASAELRLQAGIVDLATEILEISRKQAPGCRLEVGFYKNMRDIRKEGNQIQEALQEIWGTDHNISQKISYFLNEHEVQKENEPSVFKNEVTLDFNRKINEDQLHDMESLLEHVMRSLEVLNQL